MAVVWKATGHANLTRSRQSEQVPWVKKTGSVSPRRVGMAIGHEADLVWHLKDMNFIVDVNVDIGSSERISSELGRGRCLLA